MHKQIKFGKCSRCGSPAIKTCQFALRGAKSGSLCGIPVCHTHREKTDDGLTVCPAHAKFHFPASAPENRRGVSLDFVKNMVGTLLECDENSGDFRAATVMLAPMIAGSGFSAEAIAVAIGSDTGSVEPFVKNLTGSGIFAEGGGWCCNWGAIFAGKDPGELDLFSLQVSFILDALVAAGRTSRTQNADGEFSYQNIK